MKYGKYDKKFYEYLNGDIKDLPYEINRLSGPDIISFGWNFEWPLEYGQNEQYFSRWEYMKKLIDFCDQKGLLNDFFSLYFAKKIKEHNSKQEQNLFLKDLNKKLKSFGEELVNENGKFKIIKKDFLDIPEYIKLNEVKSKEIFDSGGMCDILPTNDEKILKKQLKKDSSNRQKERFLNEYEIMQKIKNEKFILPVYDLDSKNFSYKMPKCERFKDKILNMSNLEKIYYILFVLQSIQYIFSKNIFHRDIKPNNTLFYKGKWILSDFGISKDLENTTKTTRSIWGSRPYAHPDIFNSNNENNFKNFKHEYDLYSIKRIIEKDILKTITSEILIKEIKILINEWPKKIEEIFETIKKLKKICINIIINI